MSCTRLALVTTAMALMLQGCAAPPSSPQPDGPASTAPVWPPAPAAPRVRFERSIAGPYDAGIAKPLFGWVTGGGDERFVRPVGVAERAGVLYVADPGAAAVWIVDGSRNRFVKVTAAHDLRLSLPVAVAPRTDGSFYVADTGLKEVLLLDDEGRLVRVAARDGLERPAAVAYDSTSGRLYVADSALDRVTVYGDDGHLIGSWGGAGAYDGEFNHPTHLALGPGGIVLVTDALNFRVQAFEGDGRFLWKFGRHGDGSGDMAAPKGLATDSAGHVYVVDALFDAIQIFNPDGTLLLAFGDTGTGKGQFWLPGGAFLNPQNRLFVADAHNGRVQVFQTGLSSGREAEP